MAENTGERQSDASNNRARVHLSLSLSTPDSGSQHYRADSLIKIARRSTLRSVAQSRESPSKKAGGGITHTHFRSDGSHAIRHVTTTIGHFENESPNGQRICAPSLPSPPRALRRVASSRIRGFLKTNDRAENARSSERSVFGGELCFRVTGSAQNDNPQPAAAAGSYESSAHGRLCGNARHNLCEFTNGYVQQCISTYLYAHVYSIH